MRLNRETIIQVALELLDEVGLDDLTTRRLADRLGIQSPTLYWHFKSKQALLTAMAYAMLKDLDAQPVPADVEWRTLFRDNAHSFRRALLSHRDGARIHAGTIPSVDQLPKMEACCWRFLASSSAGSWRNRRRRTTPTNAPNPIRRWSNFLSRPKHSRCCAIKAPTQPSMTDCRFYCGHFARASKQRISKIGGRVNSPA